MDGSLPSRASVSRPRDVVTRFGTQPGQTRAARTRPVLPPQVSPRLAETIAANIDTVGPDVAGTPICFVEFEHHRPWVRSPCLGSDIHWIVVGDHHEILIEILR